MSAENKISFYNSVLGVAPSKEITIRELVRMIRMGDYAPGVERVRTAISKDEKRTEKNKLPAVQISGATTGKRAQAIQEGRFAHSGWLQLDVDGGGLCGKSPEDARALLGADPHVLTAFISPSGGGAKGLFQIKPCSTEEEHQSVFLAVQKYISDTHGLRIDPNTKDSARMCYLSSDPESTWQPTAVEFVPPVEPATAAQKTKGSSTGFPVPPVAPQEGVNAWVFLAARWGRQNGLSEEVTRAKIMACDDGSMHRHPTSEEVERALAKVYSVPSPETRFVYDGSRYYLDTDREFVPMDQKSVSRHLKGWGLIPLESERAICRIQTENHIHYAGPLAGHPRGIHTTGGRKLLATVSPDIIEAKPGPWPTLRAVIEGLLVDPDAGEIQVETFLAWIKNARESLVSNRRRPGQAVAFAGPRGSGKSLLIDITEAALGGRRANPYPYFTGRTNFNADLAGAELLAVDDDAGSTDIRSRRTLAANIKACLFAGAVRIEGKNKTAFTFKPCWRMLIALNDEPEALLVLPPITEDIADKITLFKCHKRPLPMPAHTLEEKDRFFAQILSEMPGMLAWLETWEIPAGLTEERSGVKAFHHPAILAGLHELSPEGQLVGLIDTAAAAGALPLPWVGTAAELKGILCHAPQTGRDAEKLLGNYPAAAGTYLGRLEGSRVEKMTLRDGIQRWHILSSGGVEVV